MCFNISLVCGHSVGQFVSVPARQVLVWSLTIKFMSRVSSRNDLQGSLYMFRSLYCAQLVNVVYWIHYGMIQHKECSYIANSFIAFKVIDLVMQNFIHTSYEYLNSFILPKAQILTITTYNTISFKSYCPQFFQAEQQS